jgi:hypothetical protein
MNITPIATQDSSGAEKVKAAFQAVLTIPGDTPAQRAVLMAEADIGVIFHRQPQIPMAPLERRPALWFVVPEGSP